MSSNDGGPAYPTSFSSSYPTEICGGMSLRDYFAAKAMQSIIINHQGSTTTTDEMVATWAYESADAMLKARAKEST